jgi:hypothetical protein
MKKLIPFNLERWQQGNCTVKTEDGGEVKHLTNLETEDGFPLVGAIEGTKHSWDIDGIYYIYNPCSPSNLMLEVDCEVVYVSLFYSKGDNIYYSGTSIKQGFHSLNPNLIKEIKVEL